MAAKEKKKYFTIDEANNALPLVRAIVGDIVAKYSEVSERKSRLDQIRESRSTRDRASRDLYGEELAQVEEALEKEIVNLQEFIDELEKLGIELKDISRGLIDFPSLMDGREVYLCWFWAKTKSATGMKSTRVSPAGSHCWTGR